MLGQTSHWHKIEVLLGPHLLRVYQLREELTVRVDAANGSVYHDPDQHTLFKVGKAKNGQYETQYKMMLSSLDPLGLSLAIDVVPGNYADDPLYIPLLPAYQKSIAGGWCAGGWGQQDECFENSGNHCF